MTFTKMAFTEIVRLEAKKRHESHKNHATSRPLSPDYEFLGLSGELEFAQQTGVMIDLERRLDGDKGVDFVVPVRLSVDVKTARKPFHLIHEAGKKFADLYVLAKYDDEKEKADLIGWEFGSALKAAPTKDFGYGIINHYIPAGDLRPMHTLINRIKFG
jgi:hypothetical protein